MGKIRGLLIVALTLLVGCTSGGGNGNGVSRDGGASAGGSSGEGVDPNDVGTGAGLISTVCNAILRCNNEAVIASQQGCQTLINAAWGCDPAVAGAKVTGFKACADSLAATSCAALAGSGFPTSECVAAVESLQRSLGAVDEGEVCEGAPCVGSAECSGFDGECLRCGEGPAKEGQPCDDLFGCEGSLFCAQNNRCTRQSPVGKGCRFPEECETGACVQEVCVQPAVGDACEDREQCGNSLGCKNGKCEKLAKPGETCGGESECTFDAFCSQGRCVAVPSCRSAGLGSTCVFDGQCTGYLACNDELCENPAELGESCSEVRCRKGLTCALDDRDDLDVCEVDVVRTPEECAAEEQDASVNKSGARRVKPWAQKALDWAQLRLARGHARK